MEAEGRDEQVEVAVTVHVDGLDVGHARELLDEHALLPLAVGRLPQPHDRALAVVLGHEVADVRHEEVGAAVAVEVHGRGAHRVRHLRDLAQLAGVAARVADEDEPVAHVAGHDLGPAVAVEVGEAHAGDDRHRRRAGRAHRPPLEALSRGLRWRPRLRRRQGLGRARLEVAHERLEVALRQRARPPLGDADAAEAEAPHVLQPLPPLRARQVGGRGRHVADRALAAHGLDEGGVRPRVGLAVEAEGDGRRGERERRAGRPGPSRTRRQVPPRAQERSSRGAV